MIVLQFMQNSIFSTRTLVRLFSGKRSLCTEYRLHFLCPLTDHPGERTVMLFTVKWLCRTAKYP